MTTYTTESGRLLGVAIDPIDTQPADTQYSSADAKYSATDIRIFKEARIALIHIVDGARYQLEAAHKRPDGSLDDTYEECHDQLLFHLFEELEAIE